VPRLATKAEQAADDALNASVRVQKVADETDRRVWRALDYVEMVSRGTRHLGIKPGEPVSVCQMSTTEQPLSTGGFVASPCYFLMIPPSRVAATRLMVGVAVRCLWRNGKREVRDFFVVRE